MGMTEIDVLALLSCLQQLSGKMKTGIQDGYSAQVPISTKDFDNLLEEYSQARLQLNAIIFQFFGNGSPEVSLS